MARSVRRRVALLAVLVVVAIPLAAVASCVARVSDAGPTIALLDGLTLPAGWELEHTTVRSFTGTDRQEDPGRPEDHIGCQGILPVFDRCPMVTRYYRVARPRAAVFDEAVQVLIRAGLPVSGAGYCGGPNVGVDSLCSVYGYPDASHEVSMLVTPDPMLSQPGYARHPSVSYVRVMANPTLVEFTLNSPQPTLHP